MTRTWIVAFDFSEHSRCALAHAASQLAMLGGGSLLVVHVIAQHLGDDGVSASADEPERARVSSGEVLGAVVGAAHEIVHAGVDASARVYFGRPAEIIAAGARAEGAERIVCGTHERHGFAHFILGSVAERIVQRSRCTVTVVKTSRQAA